MQIGLSLLSVYLGHSNIKATERYLRLTRDIFPEIINSAGDISSGVYMEIEYEK